MKILHAKNGPLVGNSYKLGASTVIGRDAESDIQLLDEGVSRRHACVVENEDGSFSIIDLGSSNGTQVRGERVKSAKLAQRDQIQIGDTIFLFGEVEPDQVDTDHPDMRLTSGPAIDATVMQDVDDVVAKLRADVAAAKSAAATPCCTSPLALRAAEEGWPHCPACGHSLG